VFYNPGCTKSKACSADVTLMRKIEAGLDEIADDTHALSAAQREEIEAQINSDELSISRAECSLIWAADAKGEVIDFRPTTNAQAVLGVRLITAPHASNGHATSRGGHRRWLASSAFTRSRPDSGHCRFPPAPTSRSRSSVAAILRDTLAPHNPAQADAMLCRAGNACLDFAKIIKEALATPEPVGPPAPMWTETAHAQPEPVG
jgi:hypothetical protein